MREKAAAEMKACGDVAASEDEGFTRRSKLGLGENEMKRTVMVVNEKRLGEDWVRMR